MIPRSLAEGRELLSKTSSSSPSPSLSLSSMIHHQYRHHYHRQYRHLIDPWCSVQTNPMPWSFLVNNHHQHVFCRQRNSQFPEVRLIDTDESSGDEIMVVSEKITPKTKMRLKMRQQKRQLASQATRGRGSWRGRPRGRGAGRPPTAKNIPRKVEPSVAKADTFEDDDDDLTCRICLSSFWYRTQVLEHLGKTHSVKDPEAFIKERRSRVWGDVM